MEKPQQSIDPLNSDNIGIYRNAENGPCEVCMVQEDDWKDRVTAGRQISYFEEVRGSKSLTCTSEAHA